MEILFKKLMNDLHTYIIDSNIHNKEKYNNVIQELKKYISKYPISDCIYHTPTYKDLFSIVLTDIEDTMNYKYRGENCKECISNEDYNPIELFFQNYKIQNKITKKSKKNIYKILYYYFNEMNFQRYYYDCYFIRLSLLNDDNEFIINKTQLIQFPGMEFQISSMNKKYKEVSLDKYCFNVLYDYCMMYKPTYKFGFDSNYMFPSENNYYHLLKKWRKSKPDYLNLNTAIDDYQFTESSKLYEESMIERMKQQIKNNYFTELKYIKYNEFYNCSKFPYLINHRILSFI